MKKIIVTAAVFGLAMAFTACSDDSSSNPSPNTDTNGPGMDKDNQTKGEACLISYSDGTKRCNTGATSVKICGGTGSIDGVSFTSKTVDSCPADANLTCADIDDGSLSYFYDETMTECPSWQQPVED